MSPKPIVPDELVRLVLMRAAGDPPRTIAALRPIIRERDRLEKLVVSSPHRTARRTDRLRQIERILRQYIYSGVDIENAVKAEALNIEEERKARLGIYTESQSDERIEV